MFPEHSVQRGDMSTTEPRPGVCESRFKSGCVARTSPTRFQHRGSHMLRTELRLNPSQKHRVWFWLTRQCKRIDGVVAVIDAIRVASLVTEPPAAEDPILVTGIGRTLDDKPRRPGRPALKEGEHSVGGQRSRDGL